MYSGLNQIFDIFFKLTTRLWLHTTGGFLLCWLTDIFSSFVLLSAFVRAVLFLSVFFITSTAVILFGFCSGLDVFQIPAQQKALTLCKDTNKKQIIQNVWHKMYDTKCIFFRPQLLQYLGRRKRNIMPIRLKTGVDIDKFCPKSHYNTDFKKKIGGLGLPSIRQSPTNF